jgi:hypothetical protein
MVARKPCKRSREIDLTPETFLNRELIKEDRLKSFARVKIDSAIFPGLPIMV